MNRATRIYALLIWCYPPSYREEFGSQMMQTFIDYYQDIADTEGRVRIDFWLSVIQDEMCNIVMQQIAAGSKGKLAMKKYTFGLVIAAVVILAIILTNVVFPGYGTDDYRAVGFMYLLFFIAFVVTGYRSVQREEPVFAGTKSGAIMGFTIMVLMTGTFFVIDNLFLDIVSKQPEKIASFAQGGFSTMREAINFGLLKGLMYGSFIGAVLGALLGTFGAGLKKYRLAR